LNANAKDSNRPASTLFGGGAGKQRGTATVIDIGQRAIKAVQVSRKGDQYELSQFVVQDAPPADKTSSPEVIGDHLKLAVEALGQRSKHVALVLGVSDALLRHTELPMVPVNDMRMMLKYNAKSYLQQDLPDYIFDCQALGVAADADKPQAEAPAKTAQKTKVLVGGAKKQTLEQLQAAARHAGLILTHVTPALACAANSFELAQPEAFANEVVALVDIGFRTSSITILGKGELCMSRVVSLGADRLTAGLAEAMGVSYAEAEGIKVGLPEEVQGAMQGLIMPLGRELRASIDFFEHQQDKVVSQVFISGGSARSPFIVESLQTELMVQTRSWNPVSFAKLNLPPEKRGEIEQVASQLAVAMGGAIAAL